METRSQTGLDNYRWVILAVTTLCLFVYAWNFYAPAPVLSLIIRDLRLSYTQAGALMSFFSLPGIFISIPAGLIADRYGPKKVIVLALMLMTIGSATTIVSGNFVLLIIGRVLQGVGTFSLGVVSAQLLSQWFSDKEVGLAMGVYNAAMPFGVVIWFNIVSLFGTGRVWQQYLLAGLVANLVLLMLFALLGRERERPACLAPAIRLSGLFASIGHAGLPIWLLGMAWLWFNAAMVSFLAFAPDFFVESGYGAGTAATVSSSVMWFSVPLCPIVGAVIDRVGGKVLFTGSAGIAMAVMVFLIPLVPSGYTVLVIITGLALPFIPTAIYALLPDVVGPHELGLGFGIIYTCMNVAIVLGPLLVGMIRDVSGSYLFAFFLMAAFAAMIAPTVLLLQRRQSAGSLQF